MTANRINPTTCRAGEASEWVLDLGEWKAKGSSALSVEQARQVSRCAGALEYERAHGRELVCLCSICRKGAARREAQRDAEQRVVRRDRWIAGEIRYFEYRAHYENSEWLTAYATKNMTKLIAEAGEISEFWNDYNEEHGEWIEMLKKCSPETYERAKWEVRALAIAEQLAVKSLRPTDEEIRQKNVRFILRGIKDEVAIDQALRVAGVPDEEREMHLAEFRRKQAEREERRQSRGATDIIAR
jgi:hypothetical protein